MTKQQLLRVVCLGDIVARPGRGLLKEKARKLRAEQNVDLLIANGENASGGVGIDPRTADEIFKSGVDVITLGDHTWRRREVRGYLDSEKAKIIRPGNFPEGAEGSGWLIKECAGGVAVGVMNLLGRTFYSKGALDCPFRKAEEYLSGPLADCHVVICDMHAEATSEKIAMARYFDGQISLLYGTHTHVPTADEQVFPKGTGYVSDLGMCGSSMGVLGMSAEVAVERFLTGLPSSYKPAAGAPELHGILAEIDTESGLTQSIERIRVKGD